MQVRKLARWCLLAMLLTASVLGTLGCNNPAPPNVAATAGSSVLSTATAGNVAAPGLSSGISAAAGTPAIPSSSRPAGNIASAGMSGAAASGTALAGAASGGSGGCGSESFAAIYRDIFANPSYSCSGPSCHGRTTALAGVGDLDLSTAAASYTALVGKASTGMLCAGKLRVKAGDAQNSLLVHKLRDETVECGTVMPVGSDAISDPELQRIVNWINAGACNN